MIDELVSEKRTYPNPGSETTEAGIRPRFAGVLYVTLGRELEGGHWIVEIKEMPHCHTFGFTLTDAKRRIREALSLWVDDMTDVEIDYEISSRPRDKRGAK